MGKMPSCDSICNTANALRSYASHPGAQSPTTSTMPYPNEATPTSTPPSNPTPKPPTSASFFPVSIPVALNHPGETPEVGIDVTTTTSQTPSHPPSDPDAPKREVSGSDMLLSCLLIVVAMGVFVVTIAMASKIRFFLLVRELQRRGHNII